MGWYDEIKFEYSLPDSEAQVLTFQTKDLFMGRYLFIIDEKGRLIWRFPRHRGTDHVLTCNATIDVIASDRLEPDDGKKLGKLIWYDYRVTFKHDKVLSIEIRPSISVEEMKLTRVQRVEVSVIKEQLSRKRRGAKYRPQVGAVSITDENRFHVRIDNLPKTTEPFASILKGGDYRINSMGRDLAGGYIIVERVE